MVKKKKKKSGAVYPSRPLVNHTPGRRMSFDPRTRNSGGTPASEQREPTEPGRRGRRPQRWWGALYRQHRVVRRRWRRRCSPLCTSPWTGMRRSSRAAKRAAVPRSGDSSRRPAATTVSTATGGAGATWALDLPRLAFVPRPCGLAAR